MIGGELNKITHAVLGAAIEVHRHLGPGLLESAYNECLDREMTIRGILFERQYPLPVEYKGVRLDCGYRLDYLVAKQVVLELKAVEGILPVHEAQLLTYLQLGGWQLGLLINFNVEVLKNGIIRPPRITLRPSARSLRLCGEKSRRNKYEKSSKHSQQHQQSL